MDVAFLGLGRMGAAMARHVLDAGHTLTVWNRSPGRAADLVAAGAKEAATPNEAVAGADVVVLMLFGPDAVRDVLFGPDGVTESARPATLVVDATTLAPDDARAAANALADVGLAYVDAPVFGSVAPARAGTLRVAIGGSDHDVARALPLVQTWADPDQVLRTGPVGSASALKIVSNTGLGVAAAGLGEALRLAGDLGLNRELTLRALAAGPYGWVLGQKGDMIADRDFSAVAFSLALLAKDLRLATSAAARPVPLLEAAREDAEQALQADRGDQDYAALVAHLEDGPA